MKRILSLIAILLLLCISVSSMFSCEMPFSQTSDKEDTSNTADDGEKNDSTIPDSDKNKDENEEKEPGTTCPICNQVVEKPHVTCSVCGKYQCVGDHSNCSDMEKCYCGGGYNQEEDGSYWEWYHAKCPECKKWGCEHPVCESCGDFLWCSSICDSKHCLGGDDCPGYPVCNPDDCLCENRCSEYEICGLHTCQHTYDCTHCGESKIFCPSIIYHKQTCDGCGAPMCTLHESHYEECKACPVCGESGKAFKHMCDFCDGFLCDGSEGHQKKCDFCGLPFCKKELHKNCGKSCPGCGESNADHGLCGACGNYVCIGDHKECNYQEVCYCGGGYEEIQGNIKHWMHGRCSECEKWMCEHPICEYCDDYIACLTRCEIKICNGGLDCNSNCNRYNCTCKEGCSDYEFCNRHYCEEAHKENICERCGKEGVACVWMYYHNTFCPVCKLSDCQLDPSEGYGHEKCEIIMKQCPSCGADNMLHEHQCHQCQGYICDGKDHDGICSFCAQPLCRTEDHKDCYIQCPGCSAMNETHKICEFCSMYVCTGNHEDCGKDDGPVLGDDDRICTYCSAIVNKVFYCHECLKCTNCCTCVMMCKNCGIRGDGVRFCQDCGLCKKCCVCIYYCEKCETHLSVNTRCDNCGYCQDCCNGHSDNPKLHPHEMKDFSPNCETYAGNQHFYCEECDEIFVRILGADGISLYDIECQYCVKGDSRCNHTGEGLYMTGENPCGSMYAHYLCEVCSKYFIYDETSVVLFMECKVCNYGASHCPNCFVLTEYNCSMCGYCDNCCMCEDRSDITIYCPKCKCDVSYTSGADPDCINGGMYSTYTCNGCSYMYRISDGTDVECFDFWIAPLGHKDSDGDYVCDNCKKLYSEDYCVICRAENGIYHGCDHYYMEAVRAVNWYGVLVTNTEDGYSIKVTVSIEDKKTGTIYYYLKDGSMYDYIEVARIECEATSVNGSPYVFKYTPVNVSVLQRNTLDFINYTYVPELEFDADAVSYVMFTSVSGYNETDQTTYNDKLIAAILNLPFEVCDDCHGVKKVGDHGVCGIDGCEKNTCAGHVHGVCDHDSAYAIDISYCGSADHYYCPECNKILASMYIYGDKALYYVCDMCSANILPEMKFD